MFKGKIKFKMKPDEYIVPKGGDYGMLQFHQRWKDMIFEVWPEKEKNGYQLYRFGVVGDYEFRSSQKNFRRLFDEGKIEIISREEISK